MIGKVIQLIIDALSVNDEENDQISIAQVIWLGYIGWYIYEWNNTASLSTWILENLVSMGNPVPHVLYYKVHDVTIYSKCILYNDNPLMSN